MTVTSLGILLVVNGVLLWAIMAALHRHTVALKNLQLQIESLAVRHTDVIRDIDADGDFSAGHRSGEKPSPKHRADRVDSSTR